MSFKNNQKNKHWNISGSNISTFPSKAFQEVENGPNGVTLAPWLLLTCLEVMDVSEICWNEQFSCCSPGFCPAASHPDCYPELLFTPRVVFLSQLQHILIRWWHFVMHCGCECSQSAARGVLLTGVLQTSTFHQPESPDSVCQARQTVVRRVTMKRKWHHSPHPSGNRWGRRLRSERWGSAGGRWSTEEKQEATCVKRVGLRERRRPNQEVKREMFYVEQWTKPEAWADALTSCLQHGDRPQHFVVVLKLSVTVKQLHHSPGRADSGSHKWPPSSQGSPWPWRRPRPQSGCSRRSLQPWSYLSGRKSHQRSSSCRDFTANKFTTSTDVKMADTLSIIMSPPLSFHQELIETNVVIRMKAGTNISWWERPKCELFSLEIFPICQHGGGAAASHQGAIPMFWFHFNSRHLFLSQTQTSTHHRNFLFESSSTSCQYEHKILD